MKLISIVVPTHNESQNVMPFYERLADVFTQLPDYDFELIFIDDSVDDTPEKIKQLHCKDSRVKMIRLTRKYGQAVAIAAGLKVAKGDAAVMMDADLQDPPESIPRLINKWEKGFKLVYVERVSSSKNAIYKMGAKIFYRVLKKISSVSIPLDAGEFRLLDRDLVNFMNSLKEHSRFIRGLTVWPGFKMAKISITRSERLHGNTNYNFKRSLSVALDGFISFSVLPLRVAVFLGLGMSFLSMLGIIVHLFFWFFAVFEFITGWMTLFLGIVFLGGLNLMCLGVIGEYLGRCFTELQGRPLYIVDYTVGIRPDMEKAEIDTVGIDSADMDNAA